MKEDIQVQIPKPKKSKKRLIIFALITLIVLSAGVIAGIVLVRQPQDIREKAAVPTGTAKLFITPETKTINAGDTFTATILFDTANIAISGLTVKLEYTYTGDAPPISATQIDINPDLVLDSNWDFPYKNISEAGGKVNIEIAGLSASVDGYTTSGQENLATITFKGNHAGTINVTFNSTESVIAGKDSEQDILLIPQSSGAYTVSGTQPTDTPESTATPTASSSATPKATAPPVPSTGISQPTIISVGTGVLLLIGAIALAL